MTRSLSNVHSVGSVSSAIPSHISSAVEGQWTAIGTNNPDTSVRTVSAALGNFYTLYPASAYPDGAPSPGGYDTGLKGIMSGWCGGCYDPVSHRLYINGGGDDDYDGNEWYGFNLQTNAWVRHDDPSKWKPPPVGQYFNPDGSPGPVHTYDFLGVVPSTGICYRLLDPASPTTTAWNPALAVAALQNPKISWSQKVTKPSVVGFIGSACAWAEDRGVFYVMGRDPGGFLRYSSYNPTTNQWGAVYASGNHSAGTHYSTGAWDPTRKLFVVASNEYSFGLNAIEVVNYTNPTSPVFSQPTLTLPRWTNLGGIKYDLVRDRFVYYSDQATDRRQMWSINPSTWVVTGISPSAGDTPPVANSGAGDPGIFGRFQYCADYDVFIMVNNVSGSVYLYKPVGWSPP